MGIKVYSFKVNVRAKQAEEVEVEEQESISYHIIINAQTGSNPCHFIHASVFLVPLAFNAFN